MQKLNAKILRAPLFSILTIIILSLCSCTNNEEPISLDSLIKEMGYRTPISTYPSPYYTCKQFSSYDQNSVSPDQEGWFANHDASWFLRQEENDGRREFVMLDAKGPGSIVRFWMTFGNEDAYTGTIRFYFDGAETPEIKGPVLDIISGGALVGEPLSSSVSPETNYYQRGHNLYLPIPYSGSLKITYECPALDPEKHSPSVYYNINYRTYEEGTLVTSFSIEELKNLKPEIDKIQGKLIADNFKTLSMGNLRNHDIKGNIKIGESIDLNLSGKNAVHAIKANISAENLPQALRSTVIEISFDGEKTVWAPIGEFFGTGYQIRPYKTWYTEVRENGDMFCFWLMPFKSKADIKVINYGDQDVDVSMDIWTDSYRWGSNSMHFGASWHELNSIESGGSSWVNGDDGHIDVNYVTLKGEGVYVGTGLTIFNTADAWWGEGDEKIWVDGESFPSFIGTGTEDYFGYAWCRPEKFSHFLIAQPDGSGNFHPGMSVNLRYKILDGIPFKESIQFDLELWHWAKTIINYAPMSFWYLKPGGEWNIKPDIEAVKKPVALKKSDLIEPTPVLNGTLEGENLRVTEISHGNYQIQNGREWGWSGDSQLWWIADNGDAKLVSDFIIDEGGKYQFELTYTKAIDYADFRISINDVPYKKKITGYHDQTGKDVITQKIKLGIFELNEGVNTITLKTEGKNPKAKDRYMVGIDLIKLSRI